MASLRSPFGQRAVAVSRRSAPRPDLGESERVLTRRLRSGDLTLEDVDEESGFALGGPALRAVGIDYDLHRGRGDGGLMLTHARDLQVEGEHREGGGRGDCAETRLRRRCVHRLATLDKTCFGQAQSFMARWMIA